MNETIRILLKSVLREKWWGEVLLRSLTDVSTRLQREGKKWYFVTRREDCSRARSMEHVTRICASGRYLRPIKRSS